MKDKYIETKYKIYIYGHGRRYDELAPIIRAYDGTVMDILGIITTDTPQFVSFDGIPCYKASDILANEYDFIIITPDRWSEVVLYLEGMGVSDDKIILGRVLELPYFSPEEYFKIKKRRISILSSNCLAGVIYHHLGMRVNVPTYNCFCKIDTFYKFLSDIDIYLEDIMEEYDPKLHGILDDEGNDRLGYMPKGVLCNNPDMMWYFNHTDKVGDSIEYWNKKRFLVNRDDMVAICYIKNESHLEKFNMLKMNKIGFSVEDYGIENIVYIKEWKECLNIRRISDFNWLLYIMNQMTSGNDIQCRINWIKLLNGDKDYMRY